MAVESTTAMSRTSTVSWRPLFETTTESAGSGSVQNSPEGWMPPLKSCFGEPAPDSKRSIHMKPKFPVRRSPSAATYSPLMIRMSFSMRYW